ncbi:MAG: cytochrome c [Gammaproteobacteria bacterium]|nr:cytochrome c [Gammaproteobacteria bacterium]
MRKGEKNIILIMVVSVVSLVGVKFYQNAGETEEDPGIPYYTTATPELTSAAATLLHKHNCQECHSLWATRDFTIAVPAPALDGEGSFRDRDWLAQYFDAAVPQDILPTRLKPQYRHPSYAHLSDEDKTTLTDYMFSLKVEDWYREQTEKRRFEKLTGKKWAANE